MNQQGKLYFLFHFICKKCQKEFYNTNAYSPFVTNLAETYCVNCANLKYFNLNFSQNNTPLLFSNTYPAHLTDENINPSTNSNHLLNQQKTNFKSEKTNNILNNQNKVNKQAFEKTMAQKPKPNLQPSVSTSKDKRITGRTKQLNLRVKEKTYWRLKELASKNKCLMTEILEKALEGYEKFYKTRNYEKQ